MEFLAPSNPNTFQIFSRNSPFCPKFPTITWNKKTPLRYNVFSSKFHKTPSFLTYLPLCNSRNFKILAHFGRPTSRRNSLRKKLVDDQQVRHNPITYNPSSDFQNPNRSLDDFETLVENLNYDSAKESDFNHVGVGDKNGGLEELKSKSKPLGESILWNKLENWVDQYKTDIEDWGIGSGPIFMVFEDLEGNVKRVSVNEEEILRRCRVERQEFEDLTEVNLKILRAESLAREMESGKNVIPRKSSVAKFVVQGGDSGFNKAIQGFTLRPELFPKVSRVGSVVLCGFVVLWALKKLFTFGDKEVQYTELEKEMMRRKIKSRKEKEMLEKVSVEIVQESSELATVEKPELDKKELMNGILKAKAADKLALRDSFDTSTAKSIDLDDKIQEIRKMAKHVREIEGQEHSLSDRDGQEKQDVNEELSNEIEVVNMHSEEGESFLSNLPNGNLAQTEGIYETIEPASLNESKNADTGFLSKVTSMEEGHMQVCSTSSEKVSDDRQSTMQDLKGSESTLHSTDTRHVIQFPDTPDGESCVPKKSSTRMKPRVILSVKEARDYLSEKRDKPEAKIESPVKTVQESSAVLRLPSDNGFGSDKSRKLDMNGKEFRDANLGGTSDSTPAISACDDSTMKDKESLPTKNDGSKDSKVGCGLGDFQEPPTFLNHEDTGISAETGPSAKMENWIETNFHEVEPIVKKIGVGFKDNYTVAREKVDQHLDIKTEITQLSSSEDDSELEWMKDDSLREIVFQVRENELAGRDPFYLMDAEDKLAFFKGLEKKVEKENEKLLNVHEWLHSNIENLDYGADGISLYDTPEKIIPRWKWPPVEKNPEFLNDFLEQRKAFLAGNTAKSYPVKKDQENSIQTSTESPLPGNLAASSPALDPNNKFHDGDLKNSKTIIEGSDGSVKAGKKSVKEYWQHTKKWSQGFLESYNAETDPEVKSTMKDIGKDLDRWITEKEIQEAADLMTKLPERSKSFMEKKLNKLKREMELFGPQAVVSKYREYADEKEEDYLWWLDLPHLLCIELYTIDNGEQRVGFYSLEMAADLELEPKPYHVIAFEDAGDCKNLCYIIQAHMEMLGNGHAFVVGRPSKDAFREAKANGFSVTVIRKGELQLNVDQTLEEVEEQITEIGSKIYHDMIMQERSMDISSLMKGVFGVSGKPTNRKRLKRMKKPSKK